MATYIVARLAWEVPGDCWLRYDRTFCQAAAVNPALPWDRWKPDVWLADMVEQSAPSSEGMAAAPWAQPPWPVPAFPILQPQDVLVVPVRGLLRDLQVPSCVLHGPDHVFKECPKQARP